MLPGMDVNPIAMWTWENQDGTHSGIPGKRL